tara:strand:- start:774 stop:1694 length:921 start_codon:yes stop_codon:yes gene_type:complete
MSKIKVNEIESSNSNVKLSPKGTGLVKVKGAGGADGTVQLTSGDGVNAVKIKSPPHSAGQSHTMILPDNNAVAGGHLHVKSVTGTGATAVGQLEFKNFPTVDTSNMSASQFTTGQLTGSVLPSFTASQGAALKLLSNSVVTNTTTSYIEFSGLAENNNYYIVGKKLIPSYTNQAIPYIQFLDQYSNVLYFHVRRDYGYTTSGTNQLLTTRNYYNLEYPDKSTSWTNNTGIFTMDLSIGKTNDYARCCFYLYLGEPSDNTPSFHRAYGVRSTDYNNAFNKVRIYSDTNATTYPWAVGTAVQCFQYLK